MITANSRPRPDRFQEARSHGHQQDDEDNGVVNFGQFEETFDDPFAQETEAQVEQQRADDQAREVGKDGAAGEQDHGANGDADQAGQAALGAQFEVQGGEAELLVADEPAGEAAGEVG